jgi:hypothetical protein
MRYETTFMPTPRYRPRLETLEDRACPAAPVIHFYAIPEEPNFVLEGQVTDEDPGGLTVHFSGVYQGSATTCAYGWFSFLIEPAMLGMIYADVTDAEGLAATASTEVVSEAPRILDFQASREVFNVWVFSGRVEDEYVPGATVRLSGLPSLEGVIVAVEPDGTFSYTIELAEGEQGTACAVATDMWGLESDEALTMVLPLS